MAGNERERAALLRIAAQSWGEEAAVTLAELLPPAGDRPATARDVARLDDRMVQFERLMEARFDQVHYRFEQIDERFDRVDRRFEQVDQRFDQVDRRFEQVDLRFGSERAHADARLEERLEAMTDRITAVFERRISDAVSMQTRTLVFSQLGALVVISALAFGLA